LADNLGLVAPADADDDDRRGADLTRRRTEWAEQVRDVVARVVLIDELDAVTRHEAAGVVP
jgi:glycerol-3-phosphate O-acyltransferase